MTVEEAEEKCRGSQRYVKSNYGMWSGRDVMAWYYRIPLAPLYALHFLWLCLKGVPINLQILREKDYEPDEPGITKCPQCKHIKDSDPDPTGRVKIEVTVEK